MKRSSPTVDSIEHLLGTEIKSGPHPWNTPRENPAARRKMPALLDIRDGQFRDQAVKFNFLSLVHCAPSSIVRNPVDRREISDVSEQSTEGVDLPRTE
jgi:hypothetical protein